MKNRIRYWMFHFLSFLAYSSFYKNSAKREYNKSLEKEVPNMHRLKDTKLRKDIKEDCRNSKCLRNLSI